jgi:hypothetical protein
VLALFLLLLTEDRALVNSMLLQFQGRSGRAQIGGSDFCCPSTSLPHCYYSLPFRFTCPYSLRARPFVASSVSPFCDCLYEEASLLHVPKLTCFRRCFCRVIVREFILPPIARYFRLCVPFPHIHLPIQSPRQTSACYYLLLSMKARFCLGYECPFL